MCVKTNESFMNYKNYKKIMLSVLIFTIVLAILGLPYGAWGFINDDYGFILYSKIQRLPEIFRFFGAHDIGEAFNPPNYSHITRSFFSVMYRPMQFVLFGLETYFLGIQPYRLLLLIISFHALISVALFNLFTYFFGYTLAFFGALFFALHPSFAHWGGVFTTQIYIVDALYLFGSLFLLKKYLESDRMGYYFFSCTVCLLGVFAKETLIVMPVWVCLAGAMYRSYVLEHLDFYKNILFGLRLSIGYWCSSILYLMARAHLFPMATRGGASSMGFSLTLASFFARQRERVGDFMSYVCDIVYVGLIPSGNRLLKGTLVLIIVALLVYPFFVKRKKMLLAFLSASMMLFTWPALLLYYQPRYLYIGLPFFFLIVLFAMQFYYIRCGRSKYVMIACLSILLVTKSTAFMYKQKSKERVLHTIISAFQELSKKEEIKKRAICFVGLPMHWFGSGNAQAVQLFGKSAALPVYYDISNFVYKREPFYTIQGHAFEANLIQDGVHLRLLDHKNLSFPIRKGALSTLGEMVIHKRNADGAPVDMSVVVRKKWLDSKPVFITWDYQRQKFLPLTSL